MMATGSDSIDARIAEWRSALSRSRVVDAVDADELESHLRDQIDELEGAGLSADEAFLVSVKRLGEIDRVTAEFAREHSDRLWKQLVLTHVASDTAAPRRPFLTMLGFAVVAVVLLEAARLIATAIGDDAWLLRNAALFVLPVLAAYFVVVRRMSWRRVLPIAAAVVLLALVANLYPFTSDPEDPGAGVTSLLVAIHLPVLLWFVVGAVYLAGDVRRSAPRMEFIRFSGEWAIYYALIALGGAVLIGLTLAVLSPIAPGAPQAVFDWVVPTGAAGAVVVAAWLVEAKKSIIENLAPVLTAIFTPLFAAMLLVASVAYAVAGVGRSFDRDLLTVFDVLLLVVLGLVVYGISARDDARTSRVMDVVRFVAVLAAILLDLLVLGSMLARVTEFGATANRIAALGLNIVLLVNLAGTAWLTARILARRAPAARLERWQTGYLPVIAAWVAVVVLVLPPAFGFA